MKRKRTPAPPAVEPPALEPEVIVPEEILERAKRAIEEDRIQKTAHCVICSGETAPNSIEGLCWVCRRLKLSAWRDSDSQMPAQE